MSLLSSITSGLKSVAKSVVSTAKKAVSKAKSTISKVVSSVSALASNALSSSKSSLSTAKKLVSQAAVSNAQKASAYTTSAKKVVKQSAVNSAFASATALAQAQNIVSSEGVGASGVAASHVNTVNRTAGQPESQGFYNNIPIVGDLVQDISTFVGDLGDGVVGFFKGLETYAQLNLFKPAQSAMNQMKVAGYLPSIVDVNESENKVSVTTHSTEEWEAALGHIPTGSFKTDYYGMAGFLYNIAVPWSGANALAAPYRADMEREAWAAHPTALPSPQDMVRMELREVFKDPDRAEQLSPLPSNDFVAFMRQLGYDTFWSQSYWAAHWELPSISQGYEMLYRLRPGLQYFLPGKEQPVESFTIVDLEKLMRKQDMLPKHIEQLIAVAYQPYTRVDVRRMYKLQILETPEEVKDAYMDLGYDDFKASKLAEFTVRDVGDDDVMSIRAELIAAYKSGDLAREQLDELIRPTFRDPAMYDLYVGIIDAQLQRKKNAASSAGSVAGGKNPTLSVVKSWYKNELIGEAQARDYLKKLNYSDDDIGLYLIQWQVS